jgi:hypothetical protein
MKTTTMHHILGNKVLEYDVDDRGVIVDERENMILLLIRRTY